MENNKDIGWCLDMNSACDVFSFSKDTMMALSCCLLLAISCCLFVYLNVALRLPSVPRREMHMSHYVP